MQAFQIAAEVSKDIGFFFYGAGFGAWLLFNRERARPWRNTLVAAFFWPVALVAEMRQRKQA